MNHVLSQNELQLQIQFLPQQIQQELLAYRRSEDATASFLGKCLIIKAFQFLQIPFDWRNVLFTPKDRPFLQGSVFDFNISHSGKWIIAVVAPSQVGIDVEKHRKINLDIFNRQFNDQEWQKIRSAQVPELQFFDFWTIKEAAIKADGRGVEVLSSTSIYPNQTVQVLDSVWHFRQLNLASGYSAAVVSATPFEKELIVNEIKMNDVLHLS